VRASAFRIGTLLAMSAVRRVSPSREPLARQLQQHRGGSGRRGGFRGGHVNSANAWPARRLTMEATLDLPGSATATR
jgi:hypothetical protein